MQEVVALTLCFLVAVGTLLLLKGWISISFGFRL